MPDTITEKIDPIVTRIDVGESRATKVLLEGELPKVGDKNTAPTTTAAEDMVHAGQRRVNLIWEVVQAIISLTVVNVALFVSGRLALTALSPELSERQAAVASMSFLLLSNLSSLVVGFYFGRTNHQRTGGVGANDVGR